MNHQLVEDFKKAQNGDIESPDSDAKILFELTSPPDTGDVDVDVAWKKFDENIKTVHFEPRPTNYLLRIAAVLFVFAAISLTYYFTDSSSSIDDRISIVAKEKVELIELPDQSQVWLRPGSSITYNQNFDDRKILLDGEGYFDVTEGQGSFQVQTAEFSVKVLGTEFLVAEGKIKSRVIVSEGLVAVRAQDKIEKVEAGESALVDLSNGSLNVFDQQDPNALSWKTGKFVFNNTQLEKVISYLNGYYGDKIQIRGNIKSCKVTGAFDKLPLSEVVDEISIILSLDVRKNAETYILSGKGC